MTPKEKANDLFGKFYTAGLCNPVRPLTIEDRQRKRSAIDCALICVDEMAREWGMEVTSRTDTYDNPSIMAAIANQQYWQNVRKELEIINN